MTIDNFIRFFDKNGTDLNLGATYSPIVSLYDNSENFYKHYEGKIFFSKVSVNLIESQQLFLLEEVTGSTSVFELRKVPGQAVLTGGNPTISGIDTNYDYLLPGMTLQINATNYSVVAVFGPTSMQVSPTPPSSITTFDIYYYDYLSYTQPRTSPGTYNETVHAEFTDLPDNIPERFFLYSVDYNEDQPFIDKFETGDYDLENGSADTIDPLTGRISLPLPVPIPTQINIGVSSNLEDILKRDIYLSNHKQYRSNLVLTPTYGTNYTFYIGGTSHPLYDITTFKLQGIGATVDESFYELDLEVIEVGITGSNTYITVTAFDNSPVSASNFSGYRIQWENKFKLADIELYAEIEAEDERFKIVLANFGRKIAFENEYIFRDSDIDEGLTDFTLLNKKRKELLLEGDNIFPYMGSYRALINIINFFGYYDLRVKEYFLNVDIESPNYDKYLHVLVPKDNAQRAQVREAWNLVPSKIYKKTSLFGLFYDLNRQTENVDFYGIPDVEDAFDFSPEEVLIKLFGLKELLKKEYLPLNARIYDITGEGIYFERIRIDSWADNLNHLTLDLGTRPVFTILPKDVTYITDLRRIDNYYVTKFVEQGLTGFLGASAIDPLITAIGFTGPISSLYDTNLESYSTYVDNIYDLNGELVYPKDPSWQYMPPPIDEPNFNRFAARMNPLPDDLNVVAGGPVLLQAYFDISWENAVFNWSQLAILGPSGSPININIWTWDSIGQGEYIDMQWTLEKKGAQGYYYDSGRRPIADFVTSTQGATVFSIPGVLSVGVTGGSVNVINVLNTGYGYTTVPNVYIAGPDSPGITATGAVTIGEGGFITGVTWTGGTGYSYPPTISIDAPVPVYETTNKVLHAVSLPYEGEYDVALYIYDITNGYTVDFQKYTVLNKSVDFVSSSRKETKERAWSEFGNITWNEVTGPWYYPIHVDTKWEDCEINWESLNYSSFEKQTLFEYDLNSKICLIDRVNPTVVLSGNLTGNLNNSITLDVGDYLFFKRESSDIIVQNSPVPPDYFQTRVTGYIGATAYDVPLFGASGSTAISTSPYDTTPTLNSGDFAWINDTWYELASVGATYFTLTTPLNTDVNGSLALTYPVNLQISGAYNVSPLEKYSRILLTDNCDYLSIDPQSNFYLYVDSVDSIKITAPIDTLRKLIIANSTVGPTGATNGSGQTLYASWGIFSGTYALEITNISLTGGDTQFRLRDDNKELYYLDGNFTARLADYDVDYAETRIGVTALTYENADEFTWNENDTVSWYGLEYHGGVLCGYVIPFVAPGGSITVDEEPSFFFSGNLAIQSTKAGLTVAAAELTASQNSGVIKYDYLVLPEDELYVLGSGGVNLSLLNNEAPGATNMTLTGPPDGGSLKIPAEITVTITGGQITAVNIINPGYGYSTTPIVSISPPGCTGTAGVITLTMSGLPYAGTIVGATATPGSGYVPTPTVDVEPPTGFKPEDNWIWTGYEWVKVTGVSGSVIDLDTPLIYPAVAGDFMLLPYQYHKQLFLNPLTFQQFYYFIHGNAKNPSNEMLSYINLADGVESEWAIYPDRTYTYPLRNSILFSSIPAYSDLSMDYLYQKWVYEGSDYPPLNIYPDYSSNVLSYQSRIPYSLTLQNPYSFIDTVVSSSQKVVSQFSPVVFHYDNCSIPGKMNPIWTIKDETRNVIEVMSTQSKLMWNFTKTGNFTVILQIEDSNGNRSVGQKNSFIVVS